MIPSKPKRQTSNRPSHHECDLKLRKLRTLLQEGRWRPAEATKLQAMFGELADRFGVETAAREDQSKILLVVAEEAKPSDYHGQYPPESAYEDAIKGRDLFAFKWKSPFFAGAEIYFKFSLKGADKSEKAYIVSIHEDDPKPAR